MTFEEREYLASLIRRPMKINFQDNPYLHSLNEPQRKIVVEALQELRKTKLLSSRVDAKPSDEMFMRRLDALITEFE